MRILVAVASRHGATAEIGRRVTTVLRDAGHTVDELDVTDGLPRGHVVAGYDAYVIGSAIYEGHWIRGARRLVLDHPDELRRGAVFLFSSGPLGDDGVHVGIDTQKIDELIHAADAVEHRMFSGRLDRKDLKRLERWIVDVVRATEGDFRDWEAIDAWAHGLAAALASRADA